MRRSIVVVLTALAAACGDPDTNDNRGYTKAPLEQPTVLVRGEPTTEMSRLGDPLLPAAPVYEAEQPADTQKATTASGDGQQGGGAQVPAGATAADVQEGQKIFTSTGNCFTCHSQDGAGTAMGPALNDAQWLNIDGSFAAIQDVVKQGVSQPKQHPAPMPAMGGANLSEVQIKQVAAYVYSISTGEK